MAYDNTNSGFIGKNDRRRGDRDPDISGSINVEGVEYWVSGWKNAKGYGLKLKPKEQRSGSTRGPSRAAPSPAPAPSGGFDDDEIPF